MTFPPSPYPEPPANTPVAWQARIGAGAYTFIAVRIAGFGWFATGRYTEPMSWDALCHQLPPADGRFLLLGVAGQIGAGP